ncbi:MAG: molybdopterin-dependent oxidoreductase [Gaiellaceae bacterium]
MSAPELVTVTIDGVEVQVPKGTGLVETAAAAGIEIPVFCYEPRLGPPIGACRMCLVEVEGMPKLQAGCTMSATDGLVVRTAAASEKAADGQEATLEFILVNHPLDCPVCDKGGECPLQDLTFRWGPGNTRMRFSKRTLDKPIPVSPLIALDRERCILCYRCTRFSSDVAEDGQLVARNRGAQSVIATFEDEPYRGKFSGNVIELCPVGALTSTTYRFDARPWEIQNVPSVCGMCPVGCNIAATTREGRVRRILSRNHPEVDGGWLCDKGRFAYGHLAASDRVVDPLVRRAPRYEELSWDEAVDEAVRMLQAAEGRIATALSGSETVEVAYALGKIVRQGLNSHCAVLPEEVSIELDAVRAPLSRIGSADVVVILGDEPVAERAPIVDLWVRLARRNGAEILYRLDEQRVRSAERPVLIWSGEGAGGSEAARVATALGCPAYFLPRTANGRGVADAWAASSDGEPEDPDPIGLLIISGDEAVADPYVRAMAARAEAVLAIAMFRRPLAGLADLILPGTSYLERDGTYVNLEGRLQRLRRASIPPAPDELAVLSRIGAGIGVELSPYPSLVFEEVSAIAYGGRPYGEVGEEAELPQPVPAGQVPVPGTGTRPGEPVEGPGLRLVTYKPLFSGPAVERVPELQFQRAEPDVELSPADAERLGVLNGQEVTVRSNGTSVQLRARLAEDLSAGAARIAEDFAAGLERRVEVAP